MIALSFLVVAQVTLASGVDDAKEGLNTTANKGYLGLDNNKEDVKTGIPTDLSSMIGKVVGAALAFLGVAFFILMIYGGYTWMFSMGNEQTAGKAKDIIIAAVIGLVIVLMAYVITSFIGGTLTQ